MALNDLVYRYILETVDRASGPMRRATAQIESSAAKQSAAVLEAGKAAERGASQQARAALRVSEVTAREAEAWKSVGRVAAISERQVAQASTQTAAVVSESSLKQVQALREQGLAYRQIVREQRAAGASAAETAAVIQRAAAVEAGAATRMVGATRMQASAVATLGTRMTRTGGAIREMGHSVAMAAAPFALIGVAAVKMSVDFDAAMTRVRTQAGASQREVNHLRGAVLNLAKNSRFSPQQIAEGLYHIESLGLRGRKAMLALRVAADGAAVGNANLSDTVSALGGAIRTGIPGVGNYRRTMGELNATVGAGNMTMSDLIAGLGTGILPAAKVAGLGLRDVTSAMATLTDENVPASAAMAQLATALHFLYNPTAKARGALQDMGIAPDRLAKDLRKPQGLIRALETLREGMRRVGGGVKGEQALGDVLPGGRGRVLTMLLNNLEVVRQKYTQIERTSTRFGDAVAATHQTAAYRIHQAWSSVQTSLVNLGHTLLPMVLPPLAKILQAASNVIDAFQRAPRWVRSTGLAFGALALAAGGVATVLGAVMSLGGKVIGVYARIGRATGILAGEQEALATASGAANAGLAGGAGGAAAGAGRFGRARGFASRLYGRAPTALLAGMIGTGVAEGAGHLIGGGTGRLVGNVGSRAAQLGALGFLLGGPWGAGIGAGGGALLGGFQTMNSLNRRMVLGGVGRGAAIGAGIGSAVPLIGTVAGAGIGAVVGGITGGAAARRIERAQNRQAEKYRQDIYTADAQTIKSMAVQLDRARAQGRISEQQAQVLTNYAHERQRWLTAQQQELSRQTFTAGLQQVQTAKNVNVRGVTNLVPSLSGMAPAAQRSGADAMIALTRGLIANKRLPQTAMGTVLQAIEGRADGLRSYLLQTGQYSTRAMALGLKADQVRGRADQIVQALRKKFADAPIIARVTGRNAQTAFAQEIEFLRSKVAHSTGATRDDLERKLQAMVTLSRTYGDLERREGAQGWTDAFASIRRTAQRMRSGAEDAFKGIGQAAGDALTGVASLANQLSNTPGFGNNSPIIGGRPRPRRAGGSVGSLTPVMLSPGELVGMPGGDGFVVPGTPTAADTFHTVLPEGSAVWTWDGQARMAAGQSPTAALSAQAPHFQKGGRVRAMRRGGKLHDQYAHFAPWEIASLAHTIGGMRGADTVMSTAISFREDPARWAHATHHNRDGSTDRGLWQINSTHGSRSTYDPVGNAAAMRSIYLSAKNQRGYAHRWYDWTTYRNGIPAPSMGAARAAVREAARRKFNITGATSSSSGGRDTTKTVSRVTYAYENARLRNPFLAGVAIGAAGNRRVLGPDLGAIAAYGRATRNVDISTVSTGGGTSRVSLGLTPNAAKGLPSRKIRSLLAMVTYGKAAARRHMPYVYGGGHARFGPTGGGMDCSGFVSAVLHAGGLLGAPMTTDGLKGWGVAGPGRYVTVGVRGTSGRNAHTMMRVGNYYFESGGRGGGPHIDAGWDGRFPIVRHPRGFRAGGIIGRPRTAPEVPPVLRNLLGLPGATDPQSVGFVGWGMRTGGVVGSVARPVASLGRVVGRDLTAILRLPQSANLDEPFRVLARALADAHHVAYMRLYEIARTLAERVRHLRAAHAPRADIRRVQAAFDLVQAEMGRRIGQSVLAATGTLAGIERRQTRLQNLQTRLGIDPSSATGQIQTVAGADVDLDRLRARRDALHAAAQRARASHHAVPKALSDAIQQINDAIDSTVATRAEAIRNGIRQLAAETTATAQYRLDQHTANSAFLEAAQRVQGTADTPFGMRQRAAAIQQSIPQLQALRAAELAQAHASRQTGDIEGWRQAMLAATQTATDLANAQADAADLIKQAAEKQAQDLVDATGFQVDVTNAQLNNLDLSQQLAGTHDTSGGRQARADFIRQQVIPAIQKQLAADQANLATIRQKEGEKSDAYRQAVLKFLADQGALTQEQLAAQEAIKENTQDLKELGGTLAISYRGESFTDLVAFGLGT